MDQYRVNCDGSERKVMSMSEYDGEMCGERGR